MKLLGSHTLKGCTRKQKIVARSSAEAELYAVAKGNVSLLKDLGYEMKPVMATDAKATENIPHGRVGRLKHVDVAFLWMQDEVTSKRLRVRRVKSEEKVADLGTKLLSKAAIAKHCLALGYVNMAEESAWCSEILTLGHVFMLTLFHACILTFMQTCFH